MIKGMGEIVNIAFVGLGNHFEKSHKPYIDPRLGRVIAVADSDPENAEAVGRRHGVDKSAIYEHHRDLLENPNVGAVFVTTGDDSHFDIATDAIEAGKHVLVEKPAATTVEQLRQLPDLFDRAAAQGLRLVVCHPREFGDGPWAETAKIIGNPDEATSSRLGRVLRIDYDCHYTKPNREGLHGSFADDKLNHTIVSALQALPNVTGFRDAQLLDNGPDIYEARLVTESDEEASDGIVIRGSGHRKAHPEYHGGGVWRDWVEVISEEGTMRVEPSLGRITLTRGLDEKILRIFDTERLYDDMFSRFNRAFLECVRDPDLPDPITARTMVLGTGAAILMQQPGFDGRINERAILELAA